MTQERWQHLVHWPLRGAALIFLIDSAWKVLADINGDRAIAAYILLGAAHCRTTATESAHGRYRNRSPRPPPATTATETAGRYRNGGRGLPKP